MVCIERIKNLKIQAFALKMALFSMAAFYHGEKALTIISRRILSLPRPSLLLGEQSVFIKKTEKAGEIEKILQEGKQAVLFEKTQISL